MSSRGVDVVVIGAGIAGASVAASLAETMSVIVLEQEAFAGMHSTGRSAALFSEIYGSAPVRALSRASRSFLYSPPEGFVDQPIVRPRGALHIASAAQVGALDAFCALPDVAPAVQRQTAREARALCPILREDYIAAAALETASADVDVDVLHQGWLRQFKARGGTLVVDAEVTGLSRNGGGWCVETPEHRIEAAIVINAAGAWADAIAKLADVNTVGLQPRRRTALIVDSPSGMQSDAWPMVIDIDEQFYFRPDAGALLLSPADETPSDRRAMRNRRSWDIAIAIDRVETPRRRSKVQPRTTPLGRACAASFQDRNSGCRLSRPDVARLFLASGAGGVWHPNLPGSG